MDYGDSKVVEATLVRPGTAAGIPAACPFRRGVFFSSDFFRFLFFFIFSPGSSIGFDILVSRLVNLPGQGV